MIIAYDPPTSPMDYAGPKRFHREYISHLGRGRKNVKISAGEVIIEGNPPGMLNLAANLMDLALTEFMNEFRLEPVEELNPPGGWYGDLEPHSAKLSIERIGHAMRLSKGLRYESPPFQSDYRPPMEAGSLVDLVIGGDQSSTQVILRGTSSGLLSLAKHAIYLSQAPERARIVYGKAEGINNERNRLVFEMTRFSEDVPWAKSPPHEKLGQ